MRRSPGIYAAGTIQGAAGQPVITGTGTTWASTDASGTVSSIVAPYDDLVIPGQRPLLILSVDGVGQLTLNEPLPFGIPAGSAYTIVKRTVSPTTATLGALQALAKRGTVEAPIEAEVFDNGVSRMRLGFADDGRIQIKVGAAGADGSQAKPWKSALLIDPKTGTVSATGLAGGDQTSSFNKIYYVPGRPPNTLGIDGDLNIDFATGFVIYGPKAAGAWPPGLDVLAQIAAAAGSAKDAAASAAAAAASQTAAKGSETNAAASKADAASSAKDAATAADAALASQKAAKASEATVAASAADAAGSVKSVLAARDSAQSARDDSAGFARTSAANAGAAANSAAAAQSYVQSLQGRVFDFNLAIDPQKQVYAGGFDWMANV